MGKFKHLWPDELPRLHKWCAQKYKPSARIDGSKSLGNLGKALERRAPLLEHAGRQDEAREMPGSLHLLIKA
jgi:hypothetical protein